jgi:hypothetical protein
MLFYALTGHYVHEGITDLDRLMAVIKKPARSLTSVLPDAPESVVTLVDKALRHDPSERWQCAEDMAEAASAAFKELTGQAIPATLRSESEGMKGWTRPAVAPTVARAPALPSFVDVAMSDESLAVSVVFEPDAQGSSASATTMLERPSGENPDKK